MTGPLAATYFSWEPVLSGNGWLMLLAGCALLWVIVRLLWGKTLVSGRHGLLLIRGAALAILLAIVFGPTIVDEQAGDTSRPAMVYLFDGSQSMTLGQDQSRWDEAIRFVADAEESAGSKHSGDVRAMRFGHRLSPLVQEGEDAESDPGTPQPPDATDSRLADALRQLLPQVSPKSSAGIVLLSDGRVRASESVERLSEIFGRSDIPIHVVPIGSVGGTGDIAIVSLVVPPRVRKYTENELQVFLRSFGFEGRETTVRIRRKGFSADPNDTLASIPITLTGGAQSASLTFRVDERPEDLVVTVDPIEGEMTERNNQVSTRVEIDRTKVRVLYVSNGVVNQSTSFFQSILPGRSTAGTDGDITVASALQADEDVECTSIVSMGGQRLQRIATEYSSQATAGFPRTRAELFAYDCVIFSDVAPDVLEDEQQQWLAQWISGRGGGLIVTGATALESRFWKDSPLKPLLPAVLPETDGAYAVPMPVNATTKNHPVWRLRIEQKLNEQLVDMLPPLSVSTAKLSAKPTSLVLAQTQLDNSPVMLAHRAGRGRVLVSTASLTGSSLRQLADAWGPQPERVAGKFWRNMVYWATEESSTGRRRLVVQSDQRFYRPGQQMVINATAYDEAAKRSQQYRIWAMFEPESLEDMSIYSPVLWPDDVVRDSGEVGPRIAWGEELPMSPNDESDEYQLKLMLSETTGTGDSGMRIEMTAYEGEEPESPFDHGTQVDSTSVAIQILSDPFEQQNPLPNHELLGRIASVSGGTVLEDPGGLAKLLKDRDQFQGPPTIDTTPAWSRWWLWIGLIGLLSSEWIWRRTTGLA